MTTRAPLSVAIIGEVVDRLVLLNALGSTVTNVFFFLKISRVDSEPLPFSSTSLNRGDLKFTQDVIRYSMPSLGATPPLPICGMKQTVERHPGIRWTYHHSWSVPPTYFNLPSHFRCRSDISCGGDCNEDTLHSLRYKSFDSSFAYLARLPTSEYRTHHQVQKLLWVEKDATQGGWNTAD